MPTTNPAGITTPKDLAKSGIKVIAAGDELSTTKYATQLVDNLAKEAGYPADFAGAYAGNVVSKEENVNAVSTKIELGGGYAGIVYVPTPRRPTRSRGSMYPRQRMSPPPMTASSSRHRGKSPGPRLPRRARGADGQAILVLLGFRPPAP